MVKKVVLKTFAYIAALGTGGILYYAATKTYYDDLLIDMAAVFLSAPLLYFFFDAAKSFSRRRLSGEIYDYAKTQIDKEVRFILNHLQKVVFALDERDPASRVPGNLFALLNPEIEGHIQNNKYLGFQLFKNSGTSRKNLQDILKTPFILEKLEDSHIVAVIGIMKSLTQLETVQGIHDLYIETVEDAAEFEARENEEMGAGNAKFPERRVLMAPFTKDVNYYRINHKYLKEYSGSIFQLIKDMQKWLNMTGHELII